MKHTIATIVRNLAAIAIRFSDRLDPQPPTTTWWYYTNSGWTSTASNPGATVKWHRTS